jgi:hypothetical protein
VLSGARHGRGCWSRERHGHRIHGGRSLSSLGRESKSAKWGLDGGLMHHPPPTATADAGRRSPSRVGGQGWGPLSARYRASSDQRNLVCRRPIVNPVKRSLVEGADAAAPALIGAYACTMLGGVTPPLDDLPSHNTRKKPQRTRACACVVRSSRLLCIMRPARVGVCRRITHTLCVSQLARAPERACPTSQHTASGRR